MNNRFDRQNFLGSQSDALFADVCVGVIGLGGGGSHITQQLAHVGIGKFLLIDHDVVEESNLNRLVGGTADDAVQSVLKVDVAKRLILGISPHVDVQAFALKWQEGAAAIRDCDIIFGCLDSFEARLELERVARRYLIPYIDIGMDVHDLDGRLFVSGQTAISIPGYVCLQCMGVITERLLKQEAQNYGAGGSRPQVVWSNGALASSAVGLAIQLLCHWHDGNQTYLLEYNGNTNEVHKSSANDYLSALTCTHFSGPTDIGDPWFDRRSKL